MFKLLLQFIKFGIVGMSNTVISYLVYIFLIYIGVSYVIANIIGFVVSVVNSFFWNNRYVFKRSREEDRSTGWALVKTFIAYGSTGLVLNNILLVLLVEKIMVNKYYAPALILIITIPLNFLINKCWAFKGKTNEASIVDRGVENK